MDRESINSEVKEKAVEKFIRFCTDSVVGTEWTFHQVSPYIGKIKSTIARYLIEEFSEIGSCIYDPFCGAGTIPFEAWCLKRNVIANDLNKYGWVLTNAKLFPPDSLEEVLNLVEYIDKLIQVEKEKVDLRKCPKWVRDFFNNETLREVVAWVKYLCENESYFLLACLLGILHHQRPGFLSFPSSHTVPYLRKKRFPPEQYPELYKYRSVKERLLKKVLRAHKRIPILDNSLERSLFNGDAQDVSQITSKVDAIITSPPYMRKLDYARDNRLRLWFLGVSEIKDLDKIISPKESDFVDMMRSCFINWKSLLVPKGKCVLFLGDNFSKKYKMTLPDIIEKVATEEVGGYKVLFRHESVIPDNRRVRRMHIGNRIETVIVFEML